MANITKQKRDQMIEFLEYLKKEHTDDESVRAFNEIENHLKEKKFGLVFEEHTEEVDELLEENIPVLCEDKERVICMDDAKPYNFIIEGDNLQALYLLDKTHRGKVDCIYIDPPYNTGAKDWKYNNDYVDKNDLYRHSKWLAFMERRLKLAKHLLNPSSSSLIVTIDEKEYLRLGMLLEEMFPDARIQMISTIINPTGTKRADEFSRTNEFIYFVRIGECSIEQVAEVKTVASNVEVHWESLRRHTASNIRDAQHPNQFFPLFIDINTDSIVEIGENLPFGTDISTVPPRENCETVWPIRDNGSEMMWGLKRETFINRLNSGYVKIGRHTPNKPQKYSVSYLASGTIEDIESGKAVVTGYDEHGAVKAFYKDGKKAIPTTQWANSSHDAKVYGTLLLQQILPDRQFPFPKSVYAVKDCLNLFLANKPDALIVDFFAGSGTTLHAINLLNLEDNGNRKCVMVTNNEIGADEEKKLTSEGYKKGDKEWEALGIAKYITWPRTVCSITGKNINGEPLSGDYLAKDYNGNVISMSQGFTTNVKYFKCDWTPRKPEDYLLSNALCLHIKEMIELQNAIEVDGEKNVLLLNKEDVKRVILDADRYKKVENVWINQNIILNSEELKLLNKKGFKYIPKEYFGQELREAAE